MKKDEKFPKRVKTVVIGEGEPEIIEIEISEREARTLTQGEELNVIGESHTRLEGLEKVTGQAKYTTDIVLQGMLHGKLIRSEKAKAIIRSVDTSRAESMPGVKGVLMLDRSETRYAGEILGAVAAETEQMARDAVRAVVVEYDERPHVVNIRRAMQPDSPRALNRDNIGPPSDSDRGNVQNGFSQAEIVIEREYSTQVEIHHPLEPHATIVHWEGDGVTIYDATQTITGNKNSITRTLRRLFPDLNITDNKVRVLCEHVGGGFGSKIGFNNHITVQVRLAKQVNAPLKMVLDRYDQCVDAGNRPDSIQQYKI